MSKKPKENATETEKPEINSVENQTGPSTVQETPSAPESLPRVEIEAVPISAADLGAPLADNMPEPTNAGSGNTENMPGMGEDAENNPRNPPLTGEIKDKSNRLFDPNRHAANFDGSPKFNKNGFFISKTLGRPKKGSESETSSGPGVGTKEHAKSGASYFNTSGIPDEYDQAAELYLNLGYGLAASWFSDEIRPESQEEHASLKMPLSAVLREKGVVDLSPTQMFLISLGAYIAKKAQKPTVKERFTLLYLKVRNLWSRKNERPKIVEEQKAA